MNKNILPSFPQFNDDIQTPMQQISATPSLISSSCTENDSIQTKLYISSGLAGVFAILVCVLIFLIVILFKRKKERRKFFRQRIYNPSSSVSLNSVTNHDLNNFFQSTSQSGFNQNASSSTRADSNASSSTKSESDTSPNANISSPVNITSNNNDFGSCLKEIWPHNRTCPTLADLKSDHIRQIKRLKLFQSTEIKKFHQN